jgi:hypothetical protein
MRDRRLEGAECEAALVVSKFLIAERQKALVNVVVRAGPAAGQIRSIAARAIARLTQ